MAEERIELLPGQYRSIELPIDLESTVMRSRFIASLRRAENRSEFDRQIKGIEIKYPKATHYCWAYRFNGNHIQEHSSDAGEPAGTAGRPILGALKKYGLLNTMAVVTRYYGGVKLGVRGLIAAYGDSTKEAIEHSKVIIAEAESIIAFKMNYDLYNTLLSRLGKYSLSEDAMEISFAEVISGGITVPNSKLAALTEELESISANRTLFDFNIL